MSNCSSSTNKNSMVYCCSSNVHPYLHHRKCRPRPFSRCGRSWNWRRSQSRRWPSSWPTGQSLHHSPLKDWPRPLRLRRPIGSWWRRGPSPFCRRPRPPWSPWSRESRRRWPLTFSSSSAPCWTAPCMCSWLPSSWRRRGRSPIAPGRCTLTSWRRPTWSSFAWRRRGPNPRGAGRLRNQLVHRRRRQRQRRRNGYRSSCRALT